MTTKLIRRVEVSEVLSLEFSDCSNRYYGDFHRLLIEVDAHLETARGLIRLRYQRPLRKMAVAGAEIKSEKALLIEQFLTTVAPYMRQEGFLSKLLESLDRPGQQLWRRLS